TGPYSTLYSQIFLRNGNWLLFFNNSPARRHETRHCESAQRKHPRGTCPALSDQAQRGSRMGGSPRKPGRSPGGLLASLTQSTGKPPVPRELRFLRLAGSGPLFLITDCFLGRDRVQSRTLFPLFTILVRLGSYSHASLIPCYNFLRRDSWLRAIETGMPLPTLPGFPHDFIALRSCPLRV